MQKSANRRWQLTVRLNYGLIDDSKWQKEVGMFLASVVQPYAGAIAVFSKNYWAALQEIDLTSLMQNDARIGFSEDISPIEYEQLVAQILTEHGWDTRLTATTGDQGVDVIADKRNIKAVIQCKLYSKPVGNAAVQEAIAGKAFEQAHIAVVVTNAGFTKSARQLATASGVLLLHHDQLGELDTLAK